MIFDPLNIEPRRTQPKDSQYEDTFEFKATVDPIERREDRHQARNRIIGECGKELDRFLDKHFSSKEPQ